LQDGWLDIPPGLRDYAPPLVAADYRWSGRNFSFWFGEEFYHTGFPNAGWNPGVVISSAELTAVVAFETRGVRHAQIRGGDFGASRPSAGIKHKVISTLGSVSLKPGLYGLTLNAGSASFAWFGGALVYFACAAGLSIDGGNVWQQTFFMNQAGQKTDKILHAIRIV
jgi:hypothetical protein